VHRVATSRYYRDSLVEIMTQWSMADVMDANEVIDGLEDVKAQLSDS
jgi:hypothetical protein